MPQITELIRRAAEAIEPVSDGLEPTLRKAVRRRNRRRLGAASLGLVVAAVGIAVPLGLLRPLHRNTAVLVQPPAQLAIESATPIPSPGDVAAGLGAVWVRSEDTTGSLWKLDPASGGVQGHRQLGPPAGPFTLATGAGSVWAVGADGTVVRVDPKSLRLVSKIPTRAGAAGIGVGSGSVWVACCGPDTSLGEGRLFRIDPATNRVLSTYRLPGRPGQLTTGFGAVWVVDYSGSVLRIDPRDGAIHSIDLPWSPQSLAEVAAGLGAVWGIDRASGVFQIDRDTLHVGKPLAVDGSQMGLAIGAGAVWVNSGPLVEMDPTGRRVVNSLNVWAPSDTSAGIAVTRSAVWVADQEGDRVVRVDFSWSASPAPTV